MKVSVIILSWNTKRLLKICLRSVVNSQATNHQSPTTEVIVVDNGSTDGSPAMVEKSFPQVKLIINKENLGFAKGNNQGVRVATGDFIMLLNSDTIVQGGTIEKLARFLAAKDSPLQAVSPLLLNPDGSPQVDYYMKFPNLWQIFFYHHPIFRPIALKVPFLRPLICHSVKDSPFQVEQLPGAALMASRKVWKKVGLLDEDYHFLFEDVDWCYRARKMGGQLWVVPQAKITHLGGASWKKKLKKDSFEFYRQYFSSMLLFVKKNYGKEKLRAFQKALIINFLFRFKFRLASYFSQMNL